MLEPPSAKDLRGGAGEGMYVLVSHNVIADVKWETGKNVQAHAYLCHRDGRTHKKRTHFCGISVLFEGESGAQIRGWIPVSNCVGRLRYEDH